LPHLAANRFLVLLATLLNLLVLSRAEAADQVLTEKYRAYFERLTNDGSAAPNFTETNFSVLLSDLDSGAVIYTKNVDKPYAVGDLRRMFLNYVLYKELGGDYQFSTELLVDHLPQDVRAEGEVNVDFSRPVTKLGNLYIRGGGDPGMSLERLGKLAEELRRRNVSEIDDVILDHSFAAGDPTTPSEVSFSRAFPFDRGCLRTFVYPGQIGRSAHVSVDSSVSGVEIQSAVTTGRGNVADLDAQFKPSSDAETRQGRPGRIFTAGIIGAKSELVEICASIAPADREKVITAAISQSLKQSNIRFKSVKRGTTPADAKTLFVMQSVRLTELISAENSTPFNPEVVDQFLQQITFAKEGQLDPMPARERAVVLIKELAGERGDADYSGLFGGGSSLIYSASDFAKVLQKFIGSSAIAAEMQLTLPRVGEGGLSLPRILNPLYLRKLRSQELEEKKALIKTVRAFSSFSESSSAIVGFAEIPGVRRIAFTLLGDGGNNKVIREGIVFDLLKIALQLPVSIAEIPPLVETAEPSSTK
jgi:hypothetical protein